MAKGKLYVRGGQVVVPTDATAVSADLLSGKTAYSGNPTAKISGTMTNRGEVDTDITTKAQVVTIAAGYHNGSGTVQISATEQAKIIAGNIKSGITILGQAGSSNVVDTSSGDAIAGDIRKYKKAWVDGVEVSGQARILEPLALSINIVAEEGDISPQSYDWTTNLTAWVGKTILVDWSTVNEGGTGVAFSLFSQTITANSSGSKIMYVKSSSIVLQSGTTNDLSTQTLITFTPASLEGLDMLELSMNVYEVI